MVLTVQRSLLHLMLVSMEDAVPDSAKIWWWWGGGQMSPSPLIPLALFSQALHYIVYRHCTARHHELQDLSRPKDLIQNQGATHNLQNYFWG